MKKITLILIVFLFQYFLMAQSKGGVVNNTYLATQTIKSSARRTGRTRKIHSSKTKSNSKSFTRFLHSLLVPGLSEYKMGYKKTALSFWTAEVLLIGSAVALNIYGSNKTDDYEKFAINHAGVASTDGKKDNYWVNIGNYDNMTEYNVVKYRQRYFGDAYYSPEYNWSWDSVENRKKFDDLRIHAENAKSYSLYAVGAVVANHLISAVTASYLSNNIVVKMSLEKENSTLNNDIQLKPKLNLDYNF